jgi:hypothetical protein
MFPVNCRDGFRPAGCRPRAGPGCEPVGVKILVVPPAGQREVDGDGADGIGALGRMPVPSSGNGDAVGHDVDVRQAGCGVGNQARTGFPVEKVNRRQHLGQHATKRVELPGRYIRRHPSVHGRRVVEHRGTAVGAADLDVPLAIRVPHRRNDVDVVEFRVVEQIDDRRHVGQTASLGLADSALDDHLGPDRSSQGIDVESFQDLSF